MRKAIAITTGIFLGLMLGCSGAPSAKQSASAAPATQAATSKAAPTDARHVVYILDCSGSMIPVFDQAKSEILSSIDALPEGKSFSIVLMRLKPAPGDHFTGIHFTGMTAKARVAEKALIEFLNEVVAEDKTDPLPALDAAFDLLSSQTDSEGKKIIVITDGVFPDNKLVENLLRQRNKRGQVSLDVWCIGPKEWLEQANRFLRGMAQANGGVLRLIEEHE